MLVFAHRKLVFFALPKTGTTAIESALEPLAAVAMRYPPNLKHTPGFRYERYLKTYLAKCGLKSLETTCVLRHPVDWLGSWYRYRSRPEKDGADNSTKGMSFDAFVREYAADEPAKWAQIGSPPRFIRDSGGTIMIDHLFQYEQMDRFISFLEDRLRSKITLPRRNVSPPNNMQLSSKTLTLLETKRPQMFEDWARAARN